MLKLGIVFIFLSTAVFVVLMTVPDAVKPLAPLFCNSGEHLTNQQSTFSRPGETVTSDTFLCEDVEGHQRDITDNIMGVSIIAFLAFLLTGVAMTIIGGSRSNKRNQAIFRHNDTLPTDDPQPQQRGNWNTDANAANQRVLNDLKHSPQRGKPHLNGLNSLNGQTDKHSLAETLRQLDDAHNQRLVTDDEYQKLRQEALDNLVE